MFPGRLTTRVQTMTGAFVGTSRVLFVLPLVLLVALTSSCLPPPRVETPVYQGKNAAVSLVTVSDDAYLASHPVDLAPEVLERVLHGIRIRAQKGSVQNWMGDAREGNPVLSDGEIATLVPRLISAFSQATPEEQVVFTVVQSNGDQSGHTGGALWMYGAHLYVTITQYRYNPERPALVVLPSQQFPDPGGLNKREVLFTPTSAVEPTPQAVSGLFDHPAQILAISLEALSRVAAEDGSGPSVPPERVKAPTLRPRESTVSEPESETAAPKRHTSEARRNGEVERLKDLVIKKDLEIEALKEALQRLQRQLERQGSEGSPEGAIPEVLR